MNANYKLILMNISFRFSTGIPREVQGMGIMLPGRQGGGSLQEGWGRPPPQTLEVHHGDRGPTRSHPTEGAKREVGLGFKTPLMNFSIFNPV